ncbi:MAG: hypothetical protein ACR2FY_00950 [Pirellulaceae bacterium]
MTYHGHIQNGVAVLDTPVSLPDGTPVRIEIERTDSPFWAKKSLAELAREQSIQPCVDPAELAGDWPPNESVDDLMAFVREARRS